MKPTKEEQLDWLLDKLEELQRQCFYGQVTLKFQSGNLTVTDTTKTEKPEAPGVDAQKAQEGGF